MQILNSKSFNIICFISICFLFILIQCQNYPPDDPKRLEEEYSNLLSENQIKLTIINVLIGSNVFLLIIIIMIAIYEITNCCHRRKIETLVYSNSKNNNLIVNKQSNLVNSQSHNNNNNVKRSFDSTKMLDSIRSNNEDFIYSNNNAQNPYLNESNDSRNRSNSGYEAPVVENVVQNKNEEKNLTNDGNDNKDRKKFHLLENPY